VLSDSAERRCGELAVVDESAWSLLGPLGAAPGSSEEMALMMRAGEYF